ncbi:MAG: PEP-CTERM sorting domain-containing protein [Armatimonadetes bacterium]|nr:PEP-CTERM sorting domain-containing protein [Armatimonadota bacterium]
MKRVVEFCLVLFILVGLVCSAGAFTGSLSSPAGSGITGTGAGWWPVTFSWIVTQNPDGSWNYNYTFTSTTKSISHLIIEVSPEFTLADIIEGSFQVHQGSVGKKDGQIIVGEYAPGGGDNPGMPDPIYGIKFDGTSGLTLQLSFDTYKAPVWGDFYAKDGKTDGEMNTAYNVGFTSPDTDPIDPPSDGSVGFHILRPDTHNYVPEPSSLAALGAALPFLGLIRRGRK